MMSNNPALTLSLAKLASAVAWADGVLEPEEKHAVRDIVFSLPTLSERAWQEVEMYLDRPVSTHELNRLIRDTSELIASLEDRQRIVETLQFIADCDGFFSDEEKTAIQQIKQVLNDKPMSVAEHLKEAMSKAMGRRKQKTAFEPAREERIEDYLLNTVFYDVTAAAAEANRTMRTPEDKLRETCLAAGIMAILLSPEMEEDEGAKLIAQALETVWGLGHSDSRFIAYCSIARAKRGLDTLRACRSFYEITSNSQRDAFLRCLAAAACNDGGCSPSVSAHLAEIASYLRVPDEAYSQEIGSLSVAKNKRPTTTKSK